MSTALGQRIARGARPACGFALQQMREAANLTRMTLGAALGVDRDTIRRWETGFAHPQVRHLLPLARMLGRPVEEIIAALTGDNENGSAASERPEPGPSEATDGREGS